MQWVVWFLVAYVWVTATNDWGWNGWAAFIFACVCAGGVMGVWQVIFGKSPVGGGESIGSSSAKVRKEVASQIPL